MATAADHAELAGADLSDQRFNRARFVGFPVSFVKTNFSKGQLQGASFDLADLSGANFDNANLAGASFRGAYLSEQGDVHGATFAGSATNLTRADFIDADISGASFVGADLSHAVFSHALAQDTNFNGVRAENAVFVGAHIYGSGRAFDSADNLRGADFNGAVLAGNVDESGGFNFTHTDLADATFDGAQCIGCNFTGSTLDDTKFIGTYLPGAIFTDVESMRGAKLNDAWLYCGDRGNSSCASAGSSSERWEWVLKLGSEEDYGPVPFAQTMLDNAPLSEVATCPDGTAGCLATEWLRKRAPRAAQPPRAANPGFLLGGRIGRVPNPDLDLDRHFIVRFTASGGACEPNNLDHHGQETRPICRLRRWDDPAGRRTRASTRGRPSGRAMPGSDAIVW